MTEIPADQPADDRDESIKRRQKMIEHLKEARRLAVIEGVPNILRGPGLVQQLIVSDALGLVPCLSWRDGPGDAYDAADPKQRFEIFTAIEGRRFQAGAVGVGGRNSRDELHKRILAATLVYLAVFDPYEPLSLLRVYEVVPETMWQKAVSQIDGSASEKAHISISERWAAENGRRVIPDAGGAKAHPPTSAQRSS